MPSPGRTILVERSAYCNAIVTSTRVMTGIGNASLPNGPTGNVAGGAFFLEPDDFVGTKLFARAVCMINGTAPASSFVLSLVPVTAVAGGAAVISITTGVAVPGSTITFTTPAISSMTRSEIDLNWPTAGYYAVQLVNDQSMAANSVAQIQWFLGAR